VHNQRHTSYEPGQPLTPWVPSRRFAAAPGTARRLGAPDRRIGRGPAIVAALLLTVWISGVLVLLQAPPEERTALILGRTWRACPFNISLISLPVLIAGMWAMKGLAPPRPALAGAYAGLLAGAIAVAVYALHCPEMAVAAPFLAIWYVLGMAIPVLAGALIGWRLLRWVTALAGPLCRARL
jgi:hypothetical protein